MFELCFYIGIALIIGRAIRDVWISWRDGEFGDD